MAQSQPSLQWFAGMDPAEKEAFKSLLLSNKNNAVILRLIELVSEQINLCGSSSMEDYEKNNWALKQADLVGQRRGLRYVKELFKFIPEIGE